MTLRFRVHKMPVFGWVVDRLGADGAPTMRLSGSYSWDEAMRLACKWASVPPLSELA